MTISFAIDAETLTNQPRSLKVVHRQPPEVVAANGGYIGVPWDHDREITVVWLDESTHGTIAELLDERGGLRAHTITWNDPDGTGRTVKVDWASDPDYEITEGYVFGQITVVFRERPD